MAGEEPHQVDTFDAGRLEGRRADVSRSGWASALGTVAVVLGLLLTVTHASEWMKQAVISGSTPASLQLPAANCPDIELEEEGLTLAECEHMVARMQAYLLSAPPWFIPLQTTLSAIGTLAGLFSMFVGAALVNMRSWAPRLAIAVFSLLLLIDAAGFLAAMNAGPMIRSDSLWPTVVWFVLHLMLLTACVARFSDDRSWAESAEAT